MPPYGRLFGTQKNPIFTIGLSANLLSNIQTLINQLDISQTYINFSQRLPTLINVYCCKGCSLKGTNRDWRSRSPLGGQGIIPGDPASLLGTWQYHYLTRARLEPTSDLGKAVLGNWVWSVWVWSGLVRNCSPQCNNYLLRDHSGWARNLAKTDMSKVNRCRTSSHEKPARTPQHTG